MHVEDARRTCPLMQIIDILGDEEKFAPPLPGKLCESEMRWVRLYPIQRIAAQIVELVHEIGISGQGLWRANVLYPMPFPQPAGATKGRETAFCGNARTGQDDNCS